MPAAEKRIDPEAFDGLSREFPAVHLGHPAQTLQDGVAYTFEALAEYYKGRDLLLPFFIPYLSSLVAVQVSTRRQQSTRIGKSASPWPGEILRSPVWIGLSVSDFCRYRAASCELLVLAPSPMQLHT